MSRFWNHAEAMIKKNMAYQKRNVWSNLRVILLPVFVLSLLSVVQHVRKENEPPRAGKTSTPPRMPPLLQIPLPEFRSVKFNNSPFKDLPDASCRSTGSCPATILITGDNRTFAELVSQNFFGNTLSNGTAFRNMSKLDTYVLGTCKPPHETFEGDTAFLHSGPKPSLFYVQPRCPANSTFSAPIQGGDKDVIFECVQGLTLWRENSSVINDELIKGYLKGNKEGNINEIMGAYDLLNSSSKRFNVRLWYNATYKGTNKHRPNMLRISRAENMITNAYLQSLPGPTSKIILDYIGEISVYIPSSSNDIVLICAPILFTFIILQLLPVICSSLVYEKQEKLRIMMKMHGLGETAYWVNSYLYFFVMSTLYVCLFVGFGRLTGLHVFTLNDLSVQFVFYFVYVNLQISFAFLLSTLFSNVKTALVISYTMVFATGPFGAGLLKGLDESTFARMWVIIMELYPGFALYRGINEMVLCSVMAAQTETHGILWNSLSGIRDDLIIMAVEWFVFLMVAVYLKTVISFVRKCHKKMSTPVSHTQASNDIPSVDTDCISLEKRKVKELMREPQEEYSTLCNNLKKVYPGTDGYRENLALGELYLALRKTECFGLVGLNGAGKTSFINMMTGLTEPSSGTAWVEGRDVRTQMDEIYASFGVCLQNDFLWDTLSGREHLLFYGRLKNLRGEALTQAVENLLRSVNLFDGRVADKVAGKYSGGMRRRLSVAISLIGDPKIVYMDEPCSGVDPASRTMLLNVLAEAKNNRLIVLTTHSMVEAEHLCDRIGILKKGVLRYLGSPDEVKALHENSYIFTVNAPGVSEDDVDNLARHICRNFKKVTCPVGPYKYEMRKKEVSTYNAVKEVKRAKQIFNIQRWNFGGLTLEDVYVKLATPPPPRL